MLVIFSSISLEERQHIIRFAILKPHLKSSVWLRHLDRQGDTLWAALMPTITSFSFYHYGPTIFPYPQLLVAFPSNFPSAVMAPGGGGRASSVHTTQRAAERAAKQTVGNLGGGEVRIQGRDGRWRDSDTVAPGNDPFPPRDKKH